MMRMLPILLIVLFLVFVITQVIIPLVKRTVLFPFLRSERKTLTNEIAELHAKLEDEALITERNQLKSQLSSMQQQNSPSTSNKE